MSLQACGVMTWVYRSPNCWLSLILVSAIGPVNLDPKQGTVVVVLVADVVVLDTVEVLHTPHDIRHCTSNSGITQYPFTITRSHW
jgi:hypothetical protein